MWKKVNTWAVGGLREVGFKPDSDIMLVLSSDGRGIFDCLLGEKIDRDYFDYYSEEWDWKSGIVNGFGPLQDYSIICGGYEYPNVLKQQTIDGWRVIINNERRPNFQKIDMMASVLYIQNRISEYIEMGVFHYGIDRAIGFSDTGKSFVIATSSGITIWHRLT